MKKKRLYTKFHQVMDYALPVLVLMIVFRPALPIAAKILLATVVLLSLLVSIRTYRVSIDKHNLYLNNLFVNKVVSIAGIKTIEPAPFYYGATSGRVSEKGYRIKYGSGSDEKKIVVLLSKKKEVQEIWNELKRKVGKNT